MVFLDQEGVVQADAVVVAAAAGHRVLLRQAQAGQGLAGVQQLHGGAFDQVGVIPAAGGHRREGLQEIQGAAFAAEQRARRAFDAEQHLVGFDALAILHAPVHRHARIQLAEHRIDPGRATDHGRLAGDHAGMRQAFGGDQLRGDVAAAEVFGQRQADVGFDVGGQLGKGEVGHGGLLRRGEGGDYTRPEAAVPGLRSSAPQPVL